MVMLLSFRIRKRADNQFVLGEEKADEMVY